MQRLAFLLFVITAACTSGAGTGTATLSSTKVKSSSAKTFTGADAAGTMVLGWKIDLWEDSPGTDCLSEDNKRAGSIGIYTNQAAGSKPQAILVIGGISVVTMNPPMLIASAAATMGVDGVANLQGQVIIDEFHLTPDAMHADRIKGTVNVAGEDPGTMATVNVMGTFEAPVCSED